LVAGGGKSSAGSAITSSDIPVRQRSASAIILRGHHSAGFSIRQRLGFRSIERWQRKCNRSMVFLKDQDEL
jgi:hypothetical protein